MCLMFFDKSLFDIDHLLATKQLITSSLSGLNCLALEVHCLVPSGLSASFTPLHGFYCPPKDIKVLGVPFGFIVFFFFW